MTAPKARIIDGAALAAEVRERVKREAAAFAAEHGRRPGLATVLVGEDPASRIYVGRKREACAEAGIASIHQELAAGVDLADLLAHLERLNDDDSVDGILVQLPLPAGLDAETVLATIDPAKDVDGLTPHNAGLLAQGGEGLVPCTPAGIMELLAQGGVELAGAEAVVLGRSKLVGRPLALLLTAADATVTVCHSRTRDLAAVCRRADVLVAAAGRPGLISAEMVKPGAVVIDVGINRREDGSLAGDVNFEPVSQVAGAITPVPGGVGPMTIAMLLANTLRAARERAGVARALGAVRQE